jgi:hypothetical protein
MSDYHPAPADDHPHHEWAPSLPVCSVVVPFMPFTYSVLILRAYHCRPPMDRWKAITIPSRITMAHTVTDITQAMSLHTQVSISTQL